MSPEYDRTNTGVLFKNDSKTPGDKRPDYKGNLNVNGVELDLAAWLKDGKNGRKFMSLKIGPKREGGA
jgi:uncharacterized protein (DUF736 family)